MAKKKTKKTTKKPVASKTTGSGTPLRTKVLAYLTEHPDAVLSAQETMEAMGEGSLQGVRLCLKALAAEKKAVVTLPASHFDSHRFQLASTPADLTAADCPPPGQYASAVNGAHVNGAPEALPATDAPSLGAELYLLQLEVEILERKVRAKLARINELTRALGPVSSHMPRALLPPLSFPPGSITSSVS